MSFSSSNHSSLVCIFVLALGLSLTLVLTGCGRNPYGQIVSHLHEHCPLSTPDQCDVDLGDVFDFSWETLYVFYPDVAGDQMRETTGINYNFVSNMDDHRQFVFVWNGSVVKIKRFRNIPKDAVSFNINDGLRFVDVIPRDEARFWITKTLREGSGGVTYILSPMNE